MESFYNQRVPAAHARFDKSMRKIRHPKAHGVRICVCALSLSHSLSHTHTHDMTHSALQRPCSLPRDLARVPFELGQLETSAQLEFLQKKDKIHRSAQDATARYSRASTGTCHSFPGRCIPACPRACASACFMVSEAPPINVDASMHACVYIHLQDDATLARFDQHPQLSQPLLYSSRTGKVPCAPRRPACPHAGAPR